MHKEHPEDDWPVTIEGLRYQKSRMGQAGSSSSKFLLKEH